MFFYLFPSPTLFCGACLHSYRKKISVVFIFILFRLYRILAIRQSLSTARYGERKKRHSAGIRAHDL